MNEWERLHRQAERYKQSYPPGTRVMLLNMNDPYSPVESGMRRTVQSVDDIGQILMKWDNGNFAYDMLTNDEFSGEDIFITNQPDVCDTVMESIMTDNLKKAILKLTD